MKPVEKPKLLLETTLRQVRQPAIDVECKACGRQGTYARADLVKKHGASMTFARLRRNAALGCERLVDPAGDLCETRFPYLDGLKP